MDVFLIIKLCQLIQHIIYRSLKNFSTVAISQNWLGNKPKFDVQKPINPYETNIDITTMCIKNAC